MSDYRTGAHFSPSREARHDEARRAAVADALSSILATVNAELAQPVGDPPIFRQVVAQRGHQLESGNAHA